MNKVDLITAGVGAAVTAGVGAAVTAVVVDIPDVFLPADAYLRDMFDSEPDSSGDLGHSDSDAELVEVS
jgi:TPP-dependent trihydroxycyclohexane-1,2-dione (THcHDO) dehydratase